jgi:hypothetical protein
VLANHFLVVGTKECQVVARLGNMADILKPSHFVCQGIFWPCTTDVQVHFNAEEIYFIPIFLDVSFSLQPRGNRGL